MRELAAMKSLAVPSLRVEPGIQAEVESVLGKSETLSDFIACGLRSRDEARRAHDCVAADDVVAGLQRKLDAARARLRLR